MKILIAGDYCPFGRVAQIISNKDYSTVFSEVKTLTQQVDYSIVNLECPVVIGKALAIEKIGPNLCCTKNGVDSIKYAGFNCVTLANNHFRDYGDDGIGETLCVLKEQGVDYVGGGMNENEAAQILYKKIKEKKIAIINCCEHEFSIATETTAGSNPLNPVQQYNAIKEAKANSDYVLVIVHGGYEHFQLPSLRMVETYRFFIDAGADAVVNHHQHCYSGYEVYKEKPIFYGLGNFCFDENRIDTLWNEGYMVILSLEHKIGFEIIPYIQCAETPSVKLLIKDAFADNILELNTTIQNNSLLNKALNDYYRASSNKYGFILEPFMCRMYKILRNRNILPSFITTHRKKMAFNYINCESHREKLLFFLKESNSWQK